MEAGGVGLALQTRAASFGSGSGRRRGGHQSPIGSLRVADPAGAAVAVRACGSKPVAPLRAKKSFGGHEKLHNSVDEALLMKRTSLEILFYLNGRCIYLVVTNSSSKLLECLQLPKYSRFIVKPSFGIMRKCMKKGLSVWLDVPLDALARRIAKVGTASRPLLDQPSGDPYTMAFSKLSMLAEQRGDAYANADRLHLNKAIMMSLS